MINFKKKFVYLILILSPFLITGCQKIETTNQQTISINKIELKVEVVNSPQAIAQGLSGRESLCENCGMLFEFSDYQIRNIAPKVYL